MARSYKRDSNGRFAGGGGGGGRGGKMGKSVKNVAARAKYKNAASKLRSLEKEFGGNSPAAGSKVAKRAIGGARSGLTRVTSNLTGKKGKAPKASAAAKPAANQVAAGRAAKAAFQSKSASKRKSARARKGGSFTETRTFKESLKPKQAAARKAKKAAMK
jgi:hypothetical protein